MTFQSPEEKRRAQALKAADLINKAQRILITSQKSPRGDALASALALAASLDNLGKDAYLVIPNGVNGRWQFLPQLEKIKPTLAATRPLIIKVSITAGEIAEARFEETDAALYFVINPEKTPLSAAAVSIETHAEPFDLVITLGVAELEQLEELMNEDARLLYDTSILNIDNQSENNTFGEFNLVQLTASSLAEITQELILALNIKPDESSGETATLLLAGLISATQNFQDVRTTPDSFQTAADLIKQGADQQLIIKNLYRTKPLNALKLWGKAMINLEFDPVTEMALAKLAPDDFEETVTSNKDVSFVIEEMRTNLAKAKTLALLWQAEPSAPVSGYVECANPERLDLLQSTFGGSLKNHHLIFQSENAALEEVAEQVSQLVKNS